MQNLVAITPGLRRFLYFTAATTGAMILVVEILGAKMLSPYFGSSHFVWTAQIAVTLVSLAAGYWFGGNLVDRNPQLHRLYKCLAGAALYLVFTVPVVEKVSYAFLEFKLATGALFASLFLFLVPLTLLAATGPFLIRVLTLHVDKIGGQVGRLSAISTLGSVLGTVLIGYVLLPFFSNSTTMFIAAGVILLLPILYFAIWGRAKTAVAIVLLGALFISGSHLAQARYSGQFQKMTTLYSGNSNFGQLQVVEFKNSTRRFYLNDYLLQNTYDTAEKASLSLFTYMLHELAWAYQPNLKSALCIGMGVGIVPNQLARENVKVDVVEINPAIVPVAEKYFGFDPSGCNVVIGDGRFFINKSQAKYDSIILDAFLGDASPSHLMSREAFVEMARLLGADGVLVINSFGDYRHGRDFFLSSLDKTLRQAFKHVRIHTAGNGNVFFAASQAELKLGERPVPRFPPNSDLASQYAGAIVQAPAPNPDAGIILTDDFNPVDFHDAQNREQHRRNMAIAVRAL